MAAPMNDEFGFPLWRRVSKAIRELPAQQRLLIELRFFAALPLAEIAALAGLDGSNGARVALGHAVAQLKRSLLADGLD